MKFKLERVIFPCEDVVLVKGNGCFGEFPATSDFIKKVFGDKFVVYVEGWILNGHLHIFEILSERKKTCKKQQEV